VSGPLAVALLSGGMDSVVAAAVVQRDGYRVRTLAIDYGQRHRVELGAAVKLSRWLGADSHELIHVDLRAVGGSALTADIPVPKGDLGGELHDTIPVTYVPARNTVFLALALGAAESWGAGAITIGANHVDYSGYPDCRPAFLDAFQALANVATKAGVEGHAPRVLAPLLELSKAEIVQLGTELGVPFEDTISCYDPTPSGLACGQCEACRLRRSGFESAGVADPTRYSDS
jgi:7-cyano-7-deazaguanine synthase